MGREAIESGEESYDYISKEVDHVKRI
jgi:hypothetical protein